MIALIAIPLGLFMLSAAFVIRGGLDKITEQLHRIADGEEEADGE